MGKIKNLMVAIKILWKASKRYFILAFILSVISSVPTVVNLVVWKKVLDLIYSFLVNNEIEYGTVILYIFLHFLLSISSNILYKASLYIQGLYSLVLQKYITNEMVETLSLMQLSDLENYEVHNTIEKVNGESSEKMLGLLSKLIELTQNITTFIGMSSILISFNYKLYFVIFLSVIPMGLYSQKYFSKLFQMYDKRVEKIRFRNEIKNMISNSETFKEIKLFSSIAYLKKKVNDINDKIIDEDKKIKMKLNVEGMFSTMVEFVFTYILKGAIVITGIIAKDTIGTINMNMESATSIQNTTSNMVMIIMSMYEDCLYLSSFSKLLQYKEQALIEKQKNQREKISDFRIETIELIDICFKYTEDSEYIIKNLSFKFFVGTTYAIVGYNGEGKTTLVKIIMGLYSPQEGKILVNGRDISNYNLDEYLKKISTVFQDFVKYPLTVRENIAMGNIEEMDNLVQIKEAAELANADSFINSLSNKYEEKLVRGWENSSELSIGQWQRIAIARAYMRKGELVIFDEPSAALDARTESKILNKITTSNRDRISILITHRFLNIKKIETIIVLGDGKIESYGNHEQLFNSSKSYRDLYNSQKEMI